MKDLSYHILDIVRNSIHAGANRIETDVAESSLAGQLTLSIRDNGRGMSAEMLKKVTDPFFTTSGKKRVGLGLPLLKQNTELTGGIFSIESVENKGTTVTATFNRNHIDMIPTGDLAMTFRTLIAGNPDKDFIYRHCADDEGFVLDTAEIRKSLDGVSLNTREVLDYIADFIRENVRAMKK